MALQEQLQAILDAHVKRGVIGVSLDPRTVTSGIITAHEALSREAHADVKLGEGAARPRIISC